MDLGLEAAFHDQLIVAPLKPSLGLVPACVGEPSTIN